MSVKPYTITLRLAGEALTNEDRAQLYAEAEKHGFLHDQIIIQEDATIEVRRLNETEILRDWISSTEEQMRQRDDSIKVLQSRIDAYKALELPAAQIAAEVKSQWPEITDITLARSDKAVIMLVTTNATFAQSTAAKSGTAAQSTAAKSGSAAKSSKSAKQKQAPELSAEDLQRLANWLSVRLQTPNVQVFQHNN